jgi:protein TonB
VRNETLSIAFLISMAVHLSAILVGAVVIHEGHVPKQELLRVDLIDIPRSEPPRPPEVAAPPERNNIPRPAEPKFEPTRERRSSPLKAPLIVEEPAPRPPSISPKEEAAKPATPAVVEPTAKFEGGGSEIGIGSFFGKGDVAVVPGPGTTGGGGGTAASGLGRGSGAPGLPAQSVLRTNREAKPIQTVRANYPPMALRAGIESDVTLRIEVDAQGSVTRAEITKSGGGGFDEEALKAVKQSRFEPAQRDGQSVAAEFIYIYRFRLRR